MAYLCLSLFGSTVQVSLLYARRALSWPSHWWTCQSGWTDLERWLMSGSNDVNFHLFEIRLHSYVLIACDLWRDVHYLLVAKAVCAIILLEIRHNYVLSVVEWPGSGSLHCRSPDCVKSMTWFGVSGTCEIGYLVFSIGFLVSRSWLSTDQGSLLRKLSHII